ncbi:MAG: SCO family protein [Sphingomonas sp.]|uniref:SCO family protein n=1 Tax=Sphingomonas sp. TaxID=28214 RepID=UPI001AD302A1|nr:SCO family protein [Sphingomonas sp.]MBN8808797.1 SCO family protein [Sphingomonas sp.]
MNPRLLSLLLLLPAACVPTPETPPPLAGSTIGGSFALTDGAGRTVTDKSLGPRWRIMYFGYTSCPDVCPTTAQVIGAAMRRLDTEDAAVAAKVVPVFVTVDPQRDTPAVAQKFAQTFYPRFVGLSGSPKAVAAAAKAYGVYWSKGETTPGGGYLVQHTNAAYLMDPDNKPIALLPTDQGAEATADEIKRWVK